MISFIIPTLNEEKAIAETLRCLKAYQGIKKIIVSDSGSTDRTVSIAKEFVDKLLIHDRAHKPTIAEVRNRGAAVAEGEFFIFVDSSVTIPEIDRTMQKAFKLFEENHRLLGLTLSLRVTPKLETPLDWLIFRLIDVVYTILNNVFPFGASSGKFQMVRASAFRKIGGYNEKLVTAEDQDLFRRLNAFGRTRIETSLRMYHAGRRGHVIGWGKLLFIWIVDYLSFLLFKRSVSKEWKAIR